MFRYLGAIARAEGAFVIIPHNGAVEGLPENLRRVPSTVMTPNNRRPGEFAERGQRGYWMLLWCPPDLCSCEWMYSQKTDIRPSFVSFKSGQSMRIGRSVIWLLPTTSLWDTSYPTASCSRE